MDGVQVSQGYSHFEEAVYFLPFSSQKFLVLILSTLEGWKAESTFGIYCIQFGTDACIDMFIDTLLPLRTIAIWTENK